MLPERMLSPETLPSPEIVPPHIYWLAGALEIGGTLTIGYQKRDGRPADTRPVIAFNDKDRAFLVKIQGFLGGSIIPDRNSHSLRLSGPNVLGVLDQLEEFVPARKVQIVAIRMWAQTENRRKKIRIAKAIHGYPWYNGGNKEIYRALLENSSFVAGILDNRGSFYKILTTKKGHPYNYPGLTVSSRNVALLETIAEKFGDEAESRQRGVGKNLHYFWEPNRPSLNKIIQFTQGMLLKKPTFDPDLLQIENTKTSRGIEATSRRLSEKVFQQIQLEIENFEAGKISRLSTIGELAKLLGGRKENISSAKVKRALAGIPREVRVRRTKIIANTNNRVISENEAEKIAREIKNEVDRRRKSPLSKLTRSRAWVKKLGISRETLTRHIFSKLDKETRVYRRMAILSDAGKEGNRKRKVRHYVTPEGRGPNGIESLTLSFLKEHGLFAESFQSAKPGQFFFNDNSESKFRFRFRDGGYKKPDLMAINGDIWVIEVWGDYWHSKKFSLAEDRPRYNWDESALCREYARLGIRCLVVREGDLLDSQKKQEVFAQILSFARS